jgi:hypothetical protein
MARLTLNEAMYLARYAGFTSEDIAMAAAVAKAESGLDPEIVGRLTDDNEDLGLWQISTKWHSDKLLALGGLWRDPFINARLARLVFLERQASGQNGWTAWSVFVSGQHDKHLTLARQQLARGHLWRPQF